MLEATEPRAIGATCGGVRVWSVYVPNGREPRTPALRVQAALAGRAARRCAGRARRRTSRSPSCGDFNIAPTDADVWDPAAFAGLDPRHAGRSAPRWPRCATWGSPTSCRAR